MKFFLILLLFCGAYVPSLNAQLLARPLLLGEKSDSLVYKLQFDSLARIRIQIPFEEYEYKTYSETANLKEVKDSQPSRPNRYLSFETSQTDSIVIAIFPKNSWVSASVFYLKPRIGYNRTYDLSISGNLDRRDLVTFDGNVVFYPKRDIIKFDWSKIVNIPDNYDYQLSQIGSTPSLTTESNSVWYYALGAVGVSGVTFGILFLLDSPLIGLSENRIELPNPPERPSVR